MLVCDCCLRHHPCNATWAPNAGARQKCSRHHMPKPHGRSTRIAVSGRCLVPTHEIECVTHSSSSRNGLGFVGKAQGAPEALGWEAGQSGYSYLNGLSLSFLSLLPVLDGSNRIQSTQQGWYIGSTGAWHAGRAPEAITGTHQVLAQ